MEEVGWTACYSRLQSAAPPGHRLSLGEGLTQTSWLSKANLPMMHVCRAMQHRATVAEGCGELETCGYTGIVQYPTARACHQRRETPKQVLAGLWQTYDCRLAGGLRCLAAGKKAVEMDERGQIHDARMAPCVPGNTCPRGGDGSAGRLETTADWMFELDAQGVYTYVSPNVTESLGYTPAQIIGKPPWALTAPRDAARFRRALFARAGGGSAIAFEVAFIAGDGREIPFEVNAVPLHGDDAAPAGYLGTCHHIAGGGQDGGAVRQSVTRPEQSDRLLSNILENTPAMVACLDPDFNFIWVNSAYARASRRDPASFAGKNHFSLYPHEENESIFQRVVETGEAFSVSGKPYHHPDQPERGTTYWDWSLLPVKDEQGAVESLVLTTSDVTGRVRAEDALRESEERLRRSEGLLAVAERVGRNGGWVWDVEQQSMYWTEETYHIHGMAPHSLEAGSDAHVARSLECYHPDDRSVIEAAFRRCVETGEPYALELRFTDLQGRQMWVGTRGEAEWHEGRVIRVVGNIQDITERKQAEEAIRQSEKAVRAKLDAILLPEGDIGSLDLGEIIDLEQVQALMDEFYCLTGISVAIIDLDGEVGVATGWQDICTRFHRVNPETRRRCIESDTELASGVQPGTHRVYKCRNGLWDVATPVVVGGRHVGNLFLGQFFFDDDLPDVEVFRAQAQRYGFDEDAYIDAMQRVPRWSRETIDVVMSFYTRMAHMIAALNYGNIQLARMLAERERAEAARAELEGRLRQVQKLESIGRLAGGVAHDLNNLLVPVIGYSEILLSDYGSDPAIRGALEAIAKAGGRASDLVQQLLAFSRKQMLEFRVVDLNDILARFEPLLRSTIRENVTIHCVAASRLPRIRGDAAQLEQAIMSLAANAQEAMPDGGTLTIETARVCLDEDAASSLEGVEPGDHVVLRIADTGLGMDAETRDRVFEPFFTTRGDRGGIGLGLATVYGIVKQHGGDITVESELGAGTTFSIYLPVAAGTGARAGKDADAYENHPDHRGSETVLLVEDHEQVRCLAETILTRQGYRVLAAECGQRALTMLDEHQGPVDLLLTDVVMPRMSGKDLFHAVSARRPGIKVLYMSGYTDDVIAHHGIIDDATAFIQKPFAVEVLAARVRELLDDE